MLDTEFATLPPDALPATRVEIENAGAPLRVLTRLEFLALPLPMRVRHMISGEARFFDAGLRIETPGEIQAFLTRSD